MLKNEIDSGIPGKNYEPADRINWSANFIVIDFLIVILIVSWNYKSMRSFLNSKKAKTGQGVERSKRKVKTIQIVNFILDSGSDTGYICLKV